MGARISTINRELKFFDKALLAKKHTDGFVKIYRKGLQWERFQFEGYTLSYSRPNYHNVLALTDNWSLNGNPVSWGIEPILARLREIDNHNHDVVARIWEENEKRETLRKRSSSNDRKAMAYDLRRDFAKALNDVNTSTLEKTELRRKKERCRL